MNTINPIETDCSRIKSEYSFAKREIEESIGLKIMGLLWREKKCQYRFYSDFRGVLDTSIVTKLISAMLMLKGYTVVTEYDGDLVKVNIDWSNPNPVYAAGVLEPQQLLETDITSAEEALSGYLSYEEGCEMAAEHYMGVMKRSMALTRAMGGTSVNFMLSTGPYGNRFCPSAALRAKWQPTLTPIKDGQVAPVYCTCHGAMKVIRMMKDVLLLQRDVTVSLNSWWARVCTDTIMMTVSW